MHCYYLFVCLTGSSLIWVPVGKVVVLWEVGVVVAGYLGGRFDDGFLSDKVDDWSLIFVFEDR
jgi:hypothetical protein